jgi:N-ethylmaleimide reductase
MRGLVSAPALIATLAHLAQIFGQELVFRGEVPVERHLVGAGSLGDGVDANGTDAEAFTMNGKVKILTPRSLETHEIAGIVDEFRRAAENAKKPGFDGVELHGANGYLLDRFLRDGSNKRSDAYGGSIENRARFPLEVVDAVLSVWDAARIGYKVSPNGTVYSMSDTNPLATFGHLATELDRRGLGYLHVTEPVSGAGAVPADKRALPVLGKVFTHTIIANGGHDARLANAVARARPISSLSACRSWRTRTFQNAI